jgi:phosphonate transport system ATP-binding protein
VTKAYGDRHALGPVDLEIVFGEKIGVVGPSGAGKSTLLKLMSGAVNPSTGTVELKGRLLSSIQVRERSRIVGLMPQQFDLVPQLSARKNIEAGNSGRWSLLRTLAALLLPIHDLNASEIASHLGLEDHMNERTSRLSGGQQQRVALARLLVQNPEMMMLDEPVSSLDPSLASQILESLCGESVTPDSMQKTVVASLHSPELATRYFDRVIGLSSGMIVFDKRSSEVGDSDLSSLYQNSNLGMTQDHENKGRALIWGRD